VVDLAQVFSTPPERAQQRLSPEQLARLRERLAAGGVSLRDRPDFEERLTELRRMYEPYVVALAALPRGAFAAVGARGRTPRQLADERLGPGGQATGPGTGGE